MSATGRSRSDISDWIIVRKPVTARSDAVASPASSGNSIASQSEMPRPVAYVCRRASEVSPIPRRGLFAIRSSETVSNGLSSTWRYATRSFTSARS